MAEIYLLPFHKEIILMQQSRYFPALTGVRALAAYTVFFYHFNQFPRTSLFWRVAHEGHIGVTIFFVLSGFLICLRYINRLDFSARWFAIYIRNRIARIYPMYFLITCLTFIAMQLHSKYCMGTPSWPFYTTLDKLFVLGLNLTFLRGYFQQFIFSGIMQGWTLTVEELFYLLAPLLLLGLRGRKNVLGLLVGYGVLFLSIGCLCVRFLPHRYGLFNSYTFMLGFTFFGRCVEFLLGIGLALFVQRMPQLNTLFPFRTYGGLLAMAICWAGLVIVDEPLDQIMGTTTNAFGILLNNILLPLGIICFFTGLIFERSVLRTLLETPFFISLGKSSYVFYLIHMGFLYIIVDQHVTHWLPAIFILLILLSTTLFYFVEEPIHKLLVGRRPQLNSSAGVAAAP